VTTTKIPVLQVEDFVSVRRNSLRGFCRVTLPSGMILDDVAIHVGETRAWAMPPSKPMLKRDGVTLRGSDQKIRYTPVVSFVTKEQRDRFPDAVIQGVRVAFPNALTSV
jgi:hypothetical protein